MQKLSNIRTIETKNFIFELDALVEHESLTEIFGDGPKIQEAEASIQNGETVYFCARARVIDKQYGLVLGTDYLGACHYESYESFRRDQYATDMCAVATEEARDTISDLANGANPKALERVPYTVTVEGVPEHFEKLL